MHVIFMWSLEPTLTTNDTFITWCHNQRKKRKNGAIQVPWASKPWWEPLGNWKRWKQCFELYLEVSSISGKEEKKKAVRLLHVVGAEALEVYNTFTWDNVGDEMKVKPIMAKFEAYCNPRKNVTRERYVFNNRSQLPGKPINHFVTDLRTKAKTCELTA